MVELTAEQTAVAVAVDAFIADREPERPWLTVHGLAGSGKSTTLASIARRYPRALVAAFTGKAASILRAKTGLPVTTIHSAIYIFSGLVDDDENPYRKLPTFRDRDEDLTGKLIFVDESSMLGERIANDLISTGARIVAAGDPGQLPPVRDRQFFRDPDLTLTEIHRQALESPIIRQAHAVRAIGRYRADGENFRVVERVTEDDLRTHDVVLTWRNATRLRVGAARRRLLGFAGPVVQRGEPVMCLRNNHRLGIYNGAVYEVATDRDPGEGLNLVVGGRYVIVPAVTVEGIDRGFVRDQYDQNVVPFALAHASTIYKSQGDEWPSVLIYDEFDAASERRALLYTGITRAAERVTIVRK